MLIEVGPYPGDAARAWLAHSSQTLGMITELKGSGASLPFDIPLDVVELFQRYLDDWSAAVNGADAFYWVGKPPAAELRHLLTYWLNLARFVNEHPEVELSPPTAARFYPAIVGDLLTALEGDPDHAGFAGRARASWPGLGDSGSCRR